MKDILASQEEATQVQESLAALERDRQERQARIEEANRQNELDRIERARKEREGEVHFVARLVVERVNVFPPKPSGRSDVADPKPIRKVTDVETINLKGPELEPLLNRIKARMALVHDDGIIDPKSKPGPVLRSGRRSAVIGEDFDDE